MFGSCIVAQIIMNLMAPFQCSHTPADGKNKSKNKNNDDDNNMNKNN